MKLHHHIFPHLHESGEQHRAHSLSLRSLFLYLQLVLIFTAGLYLVRVKAPDILGTASFGPDKIIALTNQKRAENGLAPVVYNAQLTAAANAKISHMFSENYWAHNSPSGKTPWSFIGGSGYRYIYAGENLARDFDDANAAVNAWMNSPTHRANMLDANYREIGVAVAWGSLTGREGTLVVQMFGTPVSQVPKTPTTAEASPVPNAVSPTPTASPLAQVSPSPSPNIVATGTNPVDNPVDASSVPQTQVLAAQKFAIGRIASMLLIAFVFLLMAAEVFVGLAKKHISIRPQVFAHLMILAFMLFAIWYAVGGAVI